MRVEARVKAQQVAGTRALDASGSGQGRGCVVDRVRCWLGRSVVTGGPATRWSSWARRCRVRRGLRRRWPGVRSVRRRRRSSLGAIGDLPDDTTPEQKQACEDTLIGDAGRFSFKDLRSRGRSGSLTSSNPSPRSTQIENQTLERQEKDAWRRSEFWMANDGDGTCRGGFRIPEAQADMLRGRDPGDLRTPDATTCTTTPRLRSPTTTATLNTGTGSGWGSPSCAATCPATSSPAKADSAPP